MLGEVKLVYAGRDAYAIGVAHWDEHGETIAYLRLVITPEQLVALRDRAGLLVTNLEKSTMSLKGR